MAHTSRMVETTVLHPGTARLVDAPGVPTRFLVEARLTQGRFCVVEHRLEARTLAAPVHTHRLEDEFGYVLEGSITALIGGETVEAVPGAMLFKPRDVPHTFWNSGDIPARILEIIAPSGFEAFFVSLASQFRADTPVDDPAMGLAMVELGRQYAVDFDLPSLAELAARHDLRF